MGESLSVVTHPPHPQIILLSSTDPAATQILHEYSVLQILFTDSTFFTSVCLHVCLLQKKM